jgi:RimJ/RimL family protein N-acetyltransferase
MSPNGLLAEPARPRGEARIGWPEIRELDPANDAELRRMLVRLDAPARHRLTHPASNAHQHPFGMIGIYVEHTLAGVLAFYHCARPGQADVALVIDTPWRRRGLGWALLTAAMGWAANEKASHLRLIFSRRNWAMRRLARKANARLDLLMDEICADIAIAPAEPEQSLITT